MDRVAISAVPRNMRRIGMLLFRDAFMEALYNQQLLCVVHAAHAAEILLKARIAQEHPLLIFSKLPKSVPTKDALTLINLLENGRTLSYDELPDQLWATTGIKIDLIEEYRRFGKLRNQIIHFGMVNSNTLEKETLSYSLEVLDPLVESFWGRSVIDFIKNDPGPEYEYLIYSGMLEDSIRQKGFPIDPRLRKLLGEDSRENWEYRQAEKKSYDEFYKSKTDEEREYEGKDWESSPYTADEDKYEQMIEDRARWANFLESF